MVQTTEPVETSLFWAVYLESLWYFIKHKRFSLDYTEETNLPQAVDHSSLSV